LKNNEEIDITNYLYWIRARLAPIVGPAGRCRMRRRKPFSRSTGAMGF
jgi:hypothetical protein